MKKIMTLIIILLASTAHAQSKGACQLIEKKEGGVEEFSIEASCPRGTRIIEANCVSVDIYAGNGIKEITSTNSVRCDFVMGGNSEEEEIGDKEIIYTYGDAKLQLLCCR